jgi:dihydrofolate reductase
VSSNTLPEQNTRNLQISKLSPEELLAVAIEKVGTPVVVEGGPNFLAPLLASKAIDRFYISRVLISGDDNYFSEQLLQVNYKKIESFSKNETTFETWEPVF